MTPLAVIDNLVRHAGGNAEFWRPIIAKALRLSSTGHKTERLNAAFYGKCILPHNVYIMGLSFILFFEYVTLSNSFLFASILFDNKT